MKKERMTWVEDYLEEDGSCGNRKQRTRCTRCFKGWISINYCSKYLKLKDWIFPLRHLLLYFHSHSSGFSPLLDLSLWRRKRIINHLIIYVSSLYLHPWLSKYKGHIYKSREKENVVKCGYTCFSTWVESMIRCSSSVISSYKNRRFEGGNSSLFNHRIWDNRPISLLII